MNLNRCSFTSVPFKIRLLGNLQSHSW